MGVRQRARQLYVGLPLILSDHADWDELTTTIQELAPSEVWVTQGREEALVHWCMTRQTKAPALALHISRTRMIEGPRETFTRRRGPNLF